MVTKNIFLLLVGLFAVFGGLYVMSLWIKWYVTGHRVKDFWWYPAAFGVSILGGPYIIWKEAQKYFH